MDTMTHFVASGDEIHEERAKPGARSTLHGTLAYFAAHGKRTLALLLALLMIFFAADRAFFAARTAAVTMSLNYTQASDGLTPNSTRFNMYEIKTEPVLRRLIRYAGLTGVVEPEDLAECISVVATHDTGSESSSRFISTSYRISFENRGLVPNRSAESMLALLCKSYREYFVENYATCKTAAGENLDTLNTSTEYFTCSKLTALKIAQIKRYAAERAAESGNFTDPRSGISFSEIEQRANNLQTYEQANLYSYIIKNAVSKNAHSLRDMLLYKKRIQGINYDKYMADYRVNNEAIALYDKAMTSIFMIPTTNDHAQYYMAVTKTGMDTMVHTADERLTDAMRLFKQMESDQTIADAVRDKAVDKWQWQKTEELLAGVDERIDLLFRDLLATDKAYESARVQRYVMFSERNSARSKRYSAGIAALCTAAVALACFGCVSLRMLKKGGEGEAL